MKLNKSIIICALMVLLSCTINAANGTANYVAAGGISFDRYAGNPGGGLLIGTEFIVDSALGIKGRLLYVKNNWNYAMDELDVGGIKKILNVPLWDLTFWGHGSLGYGTENSDFVFVVGGEFRKSINKSFLFFHIVDIFASGDVILFRNSMPHEYGLITVGAVLRL